MRRAVERGLERRDKGVIRSRIWVDETLFHRCRDYVTVVTDPDRNCVVHVADDRRCAWQTSPKRMDRERKRLFRALRDSTL